MNTMTREVTGVEVTETMDYWYDIGDPEGVPGQSDSPGGPSSGGGPGWKSGPGNGVGHL